MKKYDHKAIEQKWRKEWSDSGLYDTPEDFDQSNKMYVLPQLPYPSGAGLHMGHSEVYTGADIVARFNRMKGKKVLQVLGWDSFGLPAENYAIKTNTHPRITVENAITTFKEQVDSLGISVDWNKSVGSHEPRYYKFTQWLFQFMFEQGLAYRKKQAVNWDPVDQTVLANEQVLPDGTAERSGAKVEQKMMEQWFFKITDYADRLIDDLDKVDWPEETVKRQRDWIGRSEGARINFQVKSEGGTDLGELEVFTTAHDTIYGATFMVIAPEHELLTKISEEVANWEDVQKYIEASKKKSELDRQIAKEKSGIKLEGVTAVNPLTETEIPVFVADYVLVSYGTGAIMAVPGHDDRDGEFAEKYGLEVIYVVEGHDYISYSEEIKNNLDKFKIKNSGEFDGQTFAEARKGILDKIVSLGVGERKVEYKLRDWSVSRQRFWGSPIPVVYDPEGEPHLVAFEDLPITLPDDVDFLPTGRSPLLDSEDFQKGVEEKYGKGWRREVDTLDTFVCSSWYYFRYTDPDNPDAFASEKALGWMPVDFYLGGTEHVNGHLLYSRFVTKVLFDAGVIDFDEPFLVHRHQGMIYGADGRKMSKRWGNIVNPTDVVEMYGGDTARVYLMFMGPLDQDKSWNDSSAQGVRRFLNRVYDFNDKMLSANGSGRVSSKMHKLIKKVGSDLENLRFNTAIAEFMKSINDFEADPSKVSRKDWETFLKLLAPFAPFITEELWQQLGKSDSIHSQVWPEFDESMLIDETVTLAVQVNGKLRDTVEVAADISEEAVLDLARGLDNVQKHLEGMQVTRHIYVPGRIINIIAN